MATIQELRDAEYARRASSPGVFKSRRFDSSAELLEPHYNPPGTWGVTGGLIKNGTYTMRAAPSTGVSNWPYIDDSMFLSGKSSLAFKVSPFSGQDGGGNAIISFGDGVLFGAPVESQQHSAGNEFYVQWQQKTNYSHLHTAYFMCKGYNADGTPIIVLDKYGNRMCTATKHMIVTSGDQPPGWSAKYPNGKFTGYCTKTEIVLDRNYSSWAPLLYHECGNYHGMYLGWPVASAGYNIQNAWPNGHAEVYPGTPGSQYAIKRPADHSDYVGPLPGAWNYSGEEEWMTVTIGVGGLGDRRWCPDDPRFNAANVSRWRFWDSWVKIWLGHENKPMDLIIDWSPGSSDKYFPLACGANQIDGDQEWYGKIALGPYQTSKDKTQDHGVGMVWYDNIIFSTQRIPDPLPITQSDPPPEIIMPLPQSQLDDLKTKEQAVSDAINALTPDPANDPRDALIANLNTYCGTLETAINNFKTDAQARKDADAAKVEGQDTLDAIAALPTRPTS